jgi:uncharacterized protein (DUF697 family)
MTDRIAAAEAITRRYAAYCAGAGMIPVPYLDLVALTALQVKMVSELGDLYGIEADATRVKALVGTLFASAATWSLFHGIPGQIVRRVPVLNLVGIAWKPFVSAAVTYGTGNVFITHFEQGGTVETLDASSDTAKGAFEEGSRRRGRRPGSGGGAAEPSPSRT